MLPIRRNIYHSEEIVLEIAQVVIVYTNLLLSSVIEFAWRKMFYIACIYLHEYIYTYAPRNSNKPLVPLLIVHTRLLNHLRMAVQPVSQYHILKSTNVAHNVYQDVQEPV